MRAVVSKRGVDDGNQKGGDSLQPAQENHFYYTEKIEIVKKKFIIFKIFFQIYLDITSCFL